MHVGCAKCNENSFVTEKESKESCNRQEYEESFVTAQNNYKEHDRQRERGELGKEPIHILHREQRKLKGVGSLAFSQRAMHVICICIFQFLNFNKM